MSDGANIYSKYFGHPRASQPANEFEKLTVDYLYGTLYSRSSDSTLTSTLDLRDRALINVAVLAALGRQDELQQHLEAAVHQGLGHDQLVEVMIHLAHYAGWPAGHSGMKVLEAMPKLRNDAGTSRTQEYVLGELNLNIAQWEQRRDPESIAQLHQVLSPRLLFHRADGTVVSKEQFMLALKGESPFRERVSEDLSVNIVDSRACVCLTVVTIRPNDEISRYRNVRFFALRDGGWQLESWFNYELSGSKL